MAASSRCRPVVLEESFHIVLTHAGADAMRARVFPAWRDDHSRNPDAAFNGPDFVADEATRRRYFALDLV